MTTDLELAFKTITRKAAQHSEAFDYYDGVHPLVYANERLREIFQGVQVRFTENWCSVVIDSVKDRIQLSGFSGPAGLEELLGKIYEINQLNLESDDLHEAGLVTGEAYLIVWPNDDNFPEMYYNDPRLVHAFYDAANPRVMRMAAKMWLANDEAYRMTLYYPDRLEYYRTSQKAANVTSAAAFKVDNELGEQARNPYDRIPVFHFQLKKRRIQGDLMDVIPIQNGINKLLTDMMVAAEYGAFRQRWIISNADTTQLKNAPNEIWSIPAGDGVGQQTQVGDFSPTDLNNYLNAVDKLAGDIAKITRTPKHYFYTQGGDPSGEALMALEAPLNRKVQDRIERFEPVWVQAIAFALQITGQKVNTKDLTAIYKPVATIQPRTEAEIRSLDRTAGIPLITLLRRAGWTDTELTQLEEDLEAEKATSDKLGDRLLGAFDRGQ